MADAVRLGILGAGNVVERYHLPVLRAMDGVRVEWLCDRVVERARVLGRLYRIRGAFAALEQCPDVDVVLVAIPVGYRRDALEHAFQRRWHAFCEKPFATTLAEHDWILERASSAGVEVGVGMMRRLYPATMLTRRLLAGGALGFIREIWASEGTRQRGTGRESDWYQASAAAAGGGVLMETGVHVVDQVFHVAGVETFTLGSCLFERRSGLDYEARALGSLRLGTGEEVSFGVAASRLHELFNGIVIQFDTANLTLGVTHDEGLRLHDRSGTSLARLGHPGQGGPTPSVYRAFALEWAEFLRQCRTRTPSRVDGGSARLTTRFIEACYRLDGVVEAPAWRDR